MTQEKDVIVPNGYRCLHPSPESHAEAAQLRLEELRQWRDQIPRFAIPETADATRRLATAASVPPVFIELTTVAVANHMALVRADGAPPAEIRDLVAYADAYVTLPDELEAAGAVPPVQHHRRAQPGRHGGADDVLAGATSGQAEAVRPPQTARRRHAPCAGQAAETYARGGRSEGGRARGEGCGEGGQGGPGAAAVPDDGVVAT